MKYATEFMQVQIVHVIFATHLVAPALLRKKRIIHANDRNYYGMLLIQWKKKKQTFLTFKTRIILNLSFTYFWLNQFIKNNSVEQELHTANGINMLSFDLYFTT